MAFHAFCPPVPDDADPISEVLQDLRLARASYGRSEFTAPWGVELPFKEGVRFHFVAEGSCCIRAEGVDTVWLQSGDVMLLPHGTGHVMTDSPRRRAVALEAIGPELVGNSSYRLKAGGGGARTLIVCCTIAFEGPTAHPLLEMLPVAMVVRKADQGDRDLPVLLELMAKEISRQRVGGATVMARLADIVMTKIIRAWIETRGDDAAGWLAALKDRHIGLALARMHRQPGHGWTVEALADAVGLSRSLFAERFALLLGVSPARYLLQWRMRLALVWIRNEGMKVSDAAARLGYASDAAFSRAFKRFFGVPPGGIKPRPDVRHVQS